jgi:hypothetical protein
MTNLITESNDRIRVSAIDVEMDKHLRIVNKAIGHISLGDGGISPQMAKEGYLATICAGFGGNPKIGFNGTQDLHVTRKQLEELRSSIDFLIDRDLNESIDQEDYADDNRSGS